jgi:gas vesicle protein
VAASVLAATATSGAWHQDPLVTAVVGAAVGAAAALGTGLLLGRQARRHDRRGRAAEWARQDAEAAAGAREERFEAALVVATVAARDTADTARTLRVLAALLQSPGEPDPATADLPLRSTSVQDPGVRADLERVAEALTTYRVGQPAARAAALAELRAAVPGLAELTAAEAAARAEDLTVLSTTGRAAVHAEVDALRRRGTVAPLGDDG